MIEQIRRAFETRSWDRVKDMPEGWVEYHKACDLWERLNNVERSSRSGRRSESACARSITSIASPAEYALLIERCHQFEQHNHPELFTPGLREADAAPAGRTDRDTQH
jgi:hypothetical protein